MCIDFETVQEWQKVNNDIKTENANKTEEATETAFFTIVPRAEHQTTADIDAKKQEMHNWKIFDVHEEVENNGQKAINTTWVITRRTQGDSQKIKSRLVARGFEEETTTQVDAPTVLKSTLKTMLAISGITKWQCQTTDVKAAFLQGAKIDRDIYLKPPKEANCPNSLWKLKKVVYGLNDAARHWFFSAKNELERLGCTQSKFDPALFYFSSFSGPMEGIIVVHLNDFSHGGSKTFEETTVQKLRETFHISKVEESIFKYVGLNIVNCASHIEVSQD